MAEKHDVLEANSPVPEVFKVACSSCGSEKPKYRCPQCDQRSCSLSCIKNHKLKDGCSGQRIKTKFIMKSEYNEKHLLNDYRFLEEVDRVADNALRDHRGKRKWFSGKVKQLRSKALVKGVKLKLMPVGFKKRMENTSFYNNKTKIMFWRVKLIFPQADTEYVETSVSEKVKVETFMAKYIDPVSADPVFKQKLNMYHSCDTNAVGIFLENHSAPQPSFFQIDTSESLEDTLIDMMVIEYPTFHVVTSRHFSEYPTNVPLPGAKRRRLEKGLTETCEIPPIKKHPNQLRKVYDLKSKMPDVVQDTSAVLVNSKSARENTGVEDKSEHDDIMVTLKPDYENERTDNQDTLEKDQPDYENKRKDTQVTLDKDQADYENKREDTQITLNKDQADYENKSENTQVTLNKDQPDYENKREDTQITLNKDQADYENKSEDTQVTLNKDQPDYENKHEDTQVTLNKDQPDYENKREDTQVTLNKDQPDYENKREDTQVTLNKDQADYENKREDTQVTLNKDQPDYENKREDTQVTLNKDQADYENERKDNQDTLNKDQADYENKREDNQVTLNKDQADYENERKDNQDTLDKDQADYENKREDTQVTLDKDQADYENERKDNQDTLNKDQADYENERKDNQDTLDKDQADYENEQYLNDFIRKA